MTAKEIEQLIEDDDNWMTVVSHDVIRLEVIRLDVRRHNSRIYRLSDNISHPEFTSEGIKYVPKYMVTRYYVVDNDAYRSVSKTELKKLIKEDRV